MSGSGSAIPSPVSLKDKPLPISRPSSALDHGRPSSVGPGLKGPNPSKLGLVGTGWEDAPYSPSASPKAFLARQRQAEAAQAAAMSTKLQEELLPSGLQSVLGPSTLLDGAPVTSDFPSRQGVSLDNTSDITAAFNNLKMNDREAPSSQFTPQGYPSQFGAGYPVYQNGGPPPPINSAPPPNGAHSLPPSSRRYGSQSYPDYVLFSPVNPASPELYNPEISYGSYPPQGSESYDPYSPVPDFINPAIAAGVYGQHQNAGNGSVPGTFYDARSNAYWMMSPPQSASAMLFPTNGGSDRDVQNQNQHQHHPQQQYNYAPLGAVMGSPLLMGHQAHAYLPSNFDFLSSPQNHHSQLYPYNSGNNNRGNGYQNGGGGRRKMNGHQSQSSFGGGASGYSSPGHHGYQTHASRSPLLDEFRANKTRRWELDDIFGHIVEFSGDQHGSRFIQQKLEVASEADVDMVFREVLPMAVSLSCDVFANYVIQKLFEFGSDFHRIEMAKTFEKNTLSLSQHTYGCRAIQKALEHVDQTRRAIMVNELKGHVIECVRSSNANHVIQKIVSLPFPDLDVVAEFKGHVFDLSCHAYGCRALQRCFEFLPEHETQGLYEEMHQCSQRLMLDQFGNYVIQFVLERGQPRDVSSIVAQLKGQMLQMARHKFASNVCEKALVMATSEDRQALINELMVMKSDGSSALSTLLRDQFGNYVLQRALRTAVGPQRDLLYAQVQPLCEQMKAYSTSTYSKHLVSIDRLIADYQAAASYPSSHSLSKTSSTTNFTSLNTPGLSPASSQDLSISVMPHAKNSGPVNHSRKLA